MKKSTQIFKSLSEEIRLRIINLLFAGELCVCDLMEVLDLPQSTISRHLSYLKNAEWVEGDRRGVWMYYRLIDNKDQFLNELKMLLIRYLPTLKQCVDDNARLAIYLKQKGKDACK
jgi:ArsR family transcriptional regulator, arsenate/arsenite/antimonite-responsive transcriptional repressor